MQKLTLDHERIIIVDSTRRGKRMPDSLSKTIPIWCAVLNRAIFTYSDRKVGTKIVHLPPLSVSASERDQIATRIDGWTQDFIVSFYFYRLHLNSARSFC